MSLFTSPWRINTTNIHLVRLMPPAGDARLVAFGDYILSEYTSVNRYSMGTSVIVKAHDIGGRLFALGSLSRLWLLCLDSWLSGLLRWGLILLWHTLLRPQDLWHLDRRLL